MKNIDPLNKVPFKRAKGRVKEGSPFKGSPEYSLEQGSSIPSPAADAEPEPPFHQGQACEAMHWVPDSALNPEP